MGLNILSVDFDWLMEPSINCYNNSLQNNLTVSDLLETSPGATFKLDFQKYYTLYLLLDQICRTIKDNSRIVVCDHHHDIIPYIDDVWKVKNKYTLYNIDHHHDCGYHVQNVEELNNQELNEGNWVHWCKNMKQYIWINNKNSYLTIMPDIIDIIPQYQFTHDINLIAHTSFNYVFICLSPEYVPNEYWPLFEMLIHHIHNLTTGEHSC